MAISRILSPEFLRGDDHLSRPDFSERPMLFTGVDGHCSHRGATIPGDRPRNSSGHAGPAVLLLFCLAPHGVFPAARITPRAVSSYLAFSPLPVLFSKNRRYHFCDTFRRRNLTNAAPASFTRHAAVWCSDFPLASLTTHQRSPAITLSLPRTETKERERGYRRLLFAERR